MTDQELQLELAKLLPEKIEQGVNAGRFIWIGNCMWVRDTEWLHVCWLIERNVLSADEHHAFSKLVNISDSWQQRARAILKVKGML